MAPETMYLTSADWPMRSRPLESLPITSAPNSADPTLPRPPNRLVPPMTAAAIDSSSVSTPPLCSRHVGAQLRLWRRISVCAGARWARSCADSARVPVLVGARPRGVIEAVGPHLEVEHRLDVGAV
jgi:hypothetical protein